MQVKSTGRPAFRIGKGPILGADCPWYGSTAIALLSDSGNSEATSTTKIGRLHQTRSIGFIIRSPGRHGDSHRAKKKHIPALPLWKPGKFAYENWWDCIKATLPCGAHHFPWRQGSMWASASMRYSSFACQVRVQRLINEFAVCSRQEIQSNERQEHFSTAAFPCLLVTYFPW